MDETPERILTQFLQRHDAREFTYYGRGKLVAISAGDGTATVSATSTPLRGESGGFWDCSSPEDLLAALRAGMKELCEVSDVEKMVDTFIFHLDQQHND